VSASFNLYRLQQTDTRLADAHFRRAQVEQAMQDDSITRAARLDLEQAQQKRERARDTLREAEAEADATKLKIEQTESSLYGGRGGSPRELQDMQKDAESLKRRLTVIEDTELEAMLALDEVEKSEKAARSALEEVEARANADSAKLAEEQASLLADIERLEAERQAIARSIDGDSLRKYDELRVQKKGVAVAAVADGTCSACGGPLTPAQAQAAHISETPVHCPTCGRLLYAG
jgi:predicted  nucleic acid-binding Zn-ribbon protein